MDPEQNPAEPEPQPEPQPQTQPQPQPQPQTQTQTQTQPQPIFVVCMAGWGNCIAASFTRLSTCCATFLAGWSMCWSNTNINLNVENLIRKLFKNFLVGLRITSFLLSIPLWVGGYIMATKNYHDHCSKNPAFIPCGATSLILLKVGILAPLAVEVPMFLAVVYQLHRTNLNDIHGGGPMLPRAGLCWNLSIAFFGLFISTSVALCSPRWLGATFISAAIFVTGSALFEIATSLSPRTGLVVISAAFSITFSAVVAHDSHVDDHDLAYASMIVAVCILGLSLYIHWMIEKKLKPASTRAEDA